MKTLEQLMKEIIASESLKKEFDDVIAKKDKSVLEAFMKKNGCDASIEDLKQYINEKRDELQMNSELSEAELEQVAGGTGPEFMLILGGLITLSCFVCD